MTLQIEKLIQGTIIAIFAFSGMGILNNSSAEASINTDHSQISTRDPYQQPFHPDNIWNTSIGTNAQYAPAELADVARYWVDEDNIVLTPDAPQVEIYQHNKGWSDRSENARCSIDGPLVRTVPIPDSYIVPQPQGSVENASTAILLEDGRSIFQTQPFARCEQGGIGYSQYHQRDTKDIFGTDYFGSHGGSWLSAIGGTIRLGELTNDEPISHALKINLYGEKHLYYSEQDETPGYTWPAYRADRDAPEEYNGVNPNVEMGSLLALPPEFDISRLESKPAQKIAQAMKDYGGYVVDNTAWDTIAVITENSPEGNVAQEVAETYGINIRSKFDPDADGYQWYDDMKIIFNELQVITNSSESSVGGGGDRRQPRASNINVIGGKIVNNTGNTELNSLVDEIETELLYIGEDKLLGTSDDIVQTQSVFEEDIRFGDISRYGLDYGFQDVLAGDYAIVYSNISNKLTAFLPQNFIITEAAEENLSGILQIQNISYDQVYYEELSFAETIQVESGVSAELGGQSNDNGIQLAEIKPSESQLVEDVSNGTVLGESDKIEIRDESEKEDNKSNSPMSESNSAENQSEAGENDDGNYTYLIPGGFLALILAILVIYLIKKKQQSTKK